MSAPVWAGFAVAAAAGAAARFAVDTALARRATSAFPRGTLVVNAAGSLALGFLVGSMPSGSAWLLVAGAGFCGAFTTFSTFAYETVLLVEEGNLATAVRNLAVTSVGCLTAAGVGFAAAG